MTAMDFLQAAVASQDGLAGGDGAGGDGVLRDLRLVTQRTNFNRGDSFVTLVVGDSTFVPGLVPG